MSTSSFPTVIDLLLAKFRALPTITAANTPVYDGMPGPHPPNLFVAIGGEGTPTEDGSVAWAQLGAKSTWEEYEIACYVWSWVGGDDSAATSTNDAQKTARDSAFSLYNAMQTAMLADVDLTTQNGGVRTQVNWAGTNRLTVHQSPVNPSDDGSRGRACQIDFFVHVKARVTA